MKTVFCQKLQKEAEALDSPPLPGAIGTRIQTQISQEAWRLWLAEQTKIINEERLNLSDESAYQRLEQAMCAFLFSEN